MKVSISGKSGPVFVVECETAAEVRLLFEEFESTSKNGKAAPVSIHAKGQEKKKDDEDEEEAGDEPDKEERENDEEEAGSDSEERGSRRRRLSPIREGLELLARHPWIPSVDFARELSFGDPRGLGPWRANLARKLEPLGITLDEVLKIKTVHEGRRRVTVYGGGLRLKEAIYKLGELHR